METITVLVLASVVVWIGIGGYLAMLMTRQKKLALRLAHLEMNSDEEK